MIKHIDKMKASLKLFAARTGLEVAALELFDSLDEDPDGPPVDSDDFVAAVVDIFDNTVVPRIHELIDGELPEPIEPEPEPEPEPTPTPVPKNEIKIMNTGAKMSWNSYLYDKFVFPKCGPEYTSQPFELVYANGDRLYVPSPEHMVMTPSNNKYQPGGRWSNNNPDIPTMEVYARKDQHPEWVKAVFRHNV